MSDDRKVNGDAAPANGVRGANGGGKPMFVIVMVRPLVNFFLVSLCGDTSACRAFLDAASPHLASLLLRNWVCHASTRIRYIRRRTLTRWRVGSP